MSEIGSPDDGSSGIISSIGGAAGSVLGGPIGGAVGTIAGILLSGKSHSTAAGVSYKSAVAELFDNEATIINMKNQIAALRGEPQTPDLVIPHTVAQNAVLGSQILAQYGVSIPPTVAGWTQAIESSSIDTGLQGQQQQMSELNSQLLQLQDQQTTQPSSTNAVVPYPYSQSSVAPSSLPATAAPSAAPASSAIMAGFSNPLLLVGSFVMLALFVIASMSNDSAPRPYYEHDDYEEHDHESPVSKRR